MELDITEFQPHERKKYEIIGNIPMSIGKIWEQSYIDAKRTNRLLVNNEAILITSYMSGAHTGVERIYLMKNERGQYQIVK